MAGTYSTVDGDTADLIALKAYGFTATSTEAVLAANPGLAVLGPLLAAGTTVTLPDLPTPAVAPTINLWD